MPLFKEMNLMTNTSTPKLVLLELISQDRKNISVFFSFLRLSNEVDFSDCVDGQSKVLKFPGKIAINDDGNYRLKVTRMQMRLKSEIKEVQDMNSEFDSFL